MGGAATGAPATYTSRRTVGITDPNAPVIFEDVTDKTPLANFRHRSGEAAKNYIFDTPSGGAAIFDYDSDGRPDVYLVNGSTRAAMQGKEKPPRAALYRNLGNWKFEDVTDKAGVANERWGLGSRRVSGSKSRFTLHRSSQIKTEIFLSPIYLRGKLPSSQSTSGNLTDHTEVTSDGKS